MTTPNPRYIDPEDRDLPDDDDRTEDEIAEAEEARIEFEIDQAEQREWERRANW